MTVHSFSEGIGIGVSFGGKVRARHCTASAALPNRVTSQLTHEVSDSQLQCGVGLPTAHVLCRTAQAATPLGMLVTTTLAVHNVPEGFAISMLLISKGMSVWGAALWSITTSIPQPIMAIASFLFVDHFVLIQVNSPCFRFAHACCVRYPHLTPHTLKKPNHKPLAYKHASMQACSQRTYAERTGRAHAPVWPVR